MRKIDQAWENFFRKTNLLSSIKSKKYVHVKAAYLKSVASFEPRNLAKLDTSDSRPPIFKKNNLAILAVKNGEYMIYEDKQNNTYFDLSSQNYGIPITYNTKIALTKSDTLPANSPFSGESQALDYAYISSLMRTFVGDQGLHVNTIRGRRRSSKFSFDMPGIKQKVCVDGVQIEIDSGHESKDKIVIFEAKIGKQKDFNIRQLYYPYLEWKNKSSKKIIPIFLNTQMGYITSHN